MPVCAKPCRNARCLRSVGGHVVCQTAVFVFHCPTQTHVLFRQRRKHCRAACGQTVCRFGVLCQNMCKQFRVLSDKRVACGALHQTLRVCQHHAPDFDVAATARQGVLCLARQPFGDGCRPAGLQQCCVGGKVRCFQQSRFKMLRRHGNVVGLRQAVKIVQHGTVSRQSCLKHGQMRADVCGASVCVIFVWAGKIGFVRQFFPIRSGVRVPEPFCLLLRRGVVREQMQRGVTVRAGGRCFVCFQQSLRGGLRVGGGKGKHHAACQTIVFQHWRFLSYNNARF